MAATQSANFGAEMAEAKQAMTALHDTAKSLIEKLGEMRDDPSKQEEYLLTEEPMAFAVDAPGMVARIRQWANRSMEPGAPDSQASEFPDLGLHREAVEMLNTLFEICAAVSEEDSQYQTALETIGEVKKFFADWPVAVPQGESISQTGIQSAPMPSQHVPIVFGAAPAPQQPPPSFEFGNSSTQPTQAEQRPTVPVFIFGASYPDFPGTCPSIPQPRTLARKNGAQRAQEILLKRKQNKSKSAASAQPPKPQKRRALNQYNVLNGMSIENAQHKIQEWMRELGIGKKISTLEKALPKDHNAQTSLESGILANGLTTKEFKDAYITISSTLVYIQDWACNGVGGPLDRQKIKDAATVKALGIDKGDVESCLTYLNCVAELMKDEKVLPDGKEDDDDLSEEEEEEEEDEHLADAKGAQDWMERELFTLV